MRSRLQQFWHGAEHGDYGIQIGLLYHEDRLCVPHSLRCYVIKLCHEGGGSGLPGIGQTERRICQCFDLGARTRDDVKHHVQRCVVCKRSKAIAEKTGCLNPIAPPTRPLGEVGLDFAGPFTVAAQGNVTV